VSESRSILSRFRSYGAIDLTAGEVFAKHLSLIREVKPTIPRMGVLWDYAPSAFEPRDGERSLLVDNPTRAFVFA